MMRYVKVGTTVFGAVVLSAALAAAQPATPAHSGMQHAKKVTTNERVLVGSISKFDAASKSLTVTTAKGDEVVQVAASTRINEGSKKLNVDDLASVAGHHVKIRYQEQKGQMTADSIMVSSAVAKK